MEEVVGKGTNDGNIKHENMVSTFQEKDTTLYVFFLRIRRVTE